MVVAIVSMLAGEETNFGALGVNAYGKIPPPAAVEGKSPGVA
jgi:hypothetical protein